MCKIGVKILSLVIRPSKRETTFLSLPASFFSIYYLNKVNFFMFFGSVKKSLSKLPCKVLLDSFISFFMHHTEGRVVNVPSTQSEMRTMTPCFR